MGLATDLMLKSWALHQSKGPSWEIQVYKSSDCDIVCFPIGEVHAHKHIAKLPSSYSVFSGPATFPFLSGA